MIDPVFRIIAGHEPQALAPRTVGRVKALRALQVWSAYYSDRDRYAIAKEQVMPNVIISESEDDERKTISFEIEEPTIGTDAFRLQVAALLFPEAPVAECADDVDLQVAEEALETFLGFIEPRHRKQVASSALQAIFRAVATSDIKPQAPDLQSLTITP